MQRITFQLLAILVFNFALEYNRSQKYIALHP